MVIKGSQIFYRSCDRQRRALVSDKFRDLARIFRNKKTDCPISVHEGAPGQELIRYMDKARLTRESCAFSSITASLPRHRSEAPGQRPATSRPF